MTDVLQLNADITEEMLRASAIRHNAYPPDTDFPQMDMMSGAVEELCAIIAKHNAHNQFRLRLLHRHTTIPDGQVLLGTNVTTPSGVWTRPTPISDIKVENIHPHIISLDTTYSSKGSGSSWLLCPSEFREGPSVSIDVDDKFYLDFIDSLRANCLEKTFGLEIIHSTPGKMIEFSFEAGSLLLAEVEVEGHFEFRDTAWAITVKDGVVDKDGETRCVIVQGKHIQATKMQVKTVSDVLQILRDEGLLVN